MHILIRLREYMLESLLPRSGPKLDCDIPICCDVVVDEDRVDNLVTS